MLNDSLYKSNKSNWETPKKLFDILNEEFDFNLDVCADQFNRKVAHYFDILQDGLKQKWTGISWMNPPYGKEIVRWVEKAYLEGLNGNVVVCLLPCRTDTKWWHNYVMKSDEIRLLSRRIKFTNANNMAPFPAAIVIFNNKNRLILKSMDF